VATLSGAKMNDANMIYQIPLATFRQKRCLGKESCNRTKKNWIPTDFAANSNLMQNLATASELQQFKTNPLNKTMKNGVTYKTTEGKIF